MVKIAPSIFSADFAVLGKEIESVSTAEYIHFDVIDGHFAPNTTFGIPVLQSVRKITDQVLDVHLMVERPVNFVKAFAEAGADIIVFHLEADQPQYIQEAIDIVKSYGKKVGLSIKPKTPAATLIPYIDQLDMVLVMTIEPGFGGQKFRADQVEKISAVRDMIQKRGLTCDIEVDGGINPETARICVAAGANVLVAGSDIFYAADRAKRIAEIRGER